MTRCLTLSCFLMLLLSAPPVEALDVPVAGRRLLLRGDGPGPAARSLRLLVRDAAITAPFPDPTLGATLIVSGGAEAGQCFAMIPLDPAAWTAVGGDGASRGYRYRVSSPGTQGVRSIVLRSGLLRVVARGSGWPCPLSAGAERTPLRVELRLAEGTRYCAAFGGEVKRNQAGLFRARGAAAPLACPSQELSVANLNLLHGLSCTDGANCRQDERIDLLFEWIAASGCPDVVTLQEIWQVMAPKIDARRQTVCPFPYEQLYTKVNTLDDEIVLSRYPAVSFTVTPLYIGFRHVTHARIDHPLGPVDVFTTHLASSSDLGPSPCGTVQPCPPECVTAGAATIRECQAFQMATLIEQVHDVPAPAVITGDFNAPPGSPEILRFTDRGWIDSYLAVGNPECDPATGVGCTSGRFDDGLAELELPASNETTRIDFAFLIPPAAGSCTLDPAADLDGDGKATRIFVDDPNPFAPSCGPAPLPICWPSDHEGSELDATCF
ncbi:MAG: endonuclease/exonuclease/phosphatase family protein [Myxococcota bacterium]